MQYRLNDLTRNWDIVNIKDMVEEPDRIKVICEVLSVRGEVLPMHLYLTK